MVDEKTSECWGAFLDFFKVLCKAKLSLEEEQFLIWRYYSDMSCEEIYKMIDHCVSKRAIYYTWQRAIKKLYQAYTKGV